MVRWMLDPYPVLKVEPGWRIEQEPIGTKEKFWYRLPGDTERQWLFKYPQEKTGQHWAEKIASEIAGVLSIEHAKVELAVFEDQRGTVTESFVPEDQELTHGNEVLTRGIHSYDSGFKHHQAMHTLSNILQVLDSVCAPRAQIAKLKIAEFVVLDAVIGNTDRHHQNWGLLREYVGKDRWIRRVAPSFDHASSLGRELRDERRDMLLEEDRVGSYAEKGRGAIYWSGDETRGPSPLELVRCAVSAYPALFLPALEKLERLNESKISDLVNRVPDTWMSPSARKFAIALMCYNLERLGGFSDE